MSKNLKARLAEQGASVTHGELVITHEGDRIVFHGPTGRHSLDYRCSSPSRIAAHMAGYEASVPYFQSLAAAKARADGDTD